MFRPLSAFIGLRYTKAKRDNHFISFISLASVIGIALGVIVLITVLSAMNGYEAGMRDRFLGMLSHVTVTNSDWRLPAWQKRREDVLKTKHVVAVAPFIEKQVMLKEADKVQATLLEAVLPEFEKNIGTINQYISNPSGLSTLKSGAFNIILGETLAKNLDVKIGDTVTLLSPQNHGAIGDVTGTENLFPIFRDFTLVATFKVDMQWYDAGTAYIHLDDAAELLEMPDDVTGLRVQLDDLYKAQEVTTAIADNSEDDFLITNWTTQQANIFKAIKLQKTMFFLVLILIVGVAAFNLVSTLIMVVTEKQSDIAILRTLGMSDGQVMRVFIVQGGVLGVIGTVIGVILGVMVASNLSDIVHWLEQLLNMQFLKSEVHGITQIDTKIEIMDLILIALSSFLLAIIATIFPAWKASKVQPAEALRYE
ncbi:MAG TPA: lipoprotein-releasing ABC transporter permease subunit [Leucothrix sp.]|nr:lipoprotein-releasing ABC transporter permease subunit [Leucothrix sp.]HIQ14710.1 lipoprotein-releasing ABC transporter permease subunit [Leucothrix sp.]